MKDFLKDYGSAIGPIFAFSLGILAIYIKSFIDLRLAKRQSKNKLKNLISLIEASAPPKKFYPQTSTNGFHADQARNLTNISIFAKKINTISMFINKIENDVLINCNIDSIQQFHHIKFIINYVERDINFLTNKKEKDSESSFSFAVIEEFDFHRMQNEYDRLIRVCKKPELDFNYIQ